MTPSKTVDLNAKLTKALAHHQLGQLEPAEDIYRQILKADPDHPGALHLLGVIGLQAGQFDTAAGLMERAIQLNPEDADAHNNLGQVYENLGRLDDAVAVTRKAIALKADFSAANTNLGSLLNEQGAFAEAIECHQRALQTNPGDPEVLCNLGAALLSEGNTEDAIARIRDAQLLAPDHPAVLFNLGNALREDCQLGEAVASYQRALEISPGDPEVLCNLGSALHDLDSPDEAITVLRGALEADGDFAQAHYNLCLVLLGQGRVEEAFPSVRQALRLDPENPEYWQKWEECISQVARVTLDDRLAQELETYLALETADIGKAGPVAQEIVLQDDRLAEIKRLAEAGDIPALADHLAKDAGCLALSTPLLVRSLPKSRVISVKLELFLTPIRHAFLHLADEGRLEQIAQTEGGLNFLTALAGQCFLNEYVFLETAEETRQVDALALAVTERLDQDGAVQEADEASLALIACYRLLASLDAPTIKATPESPLAEILQQTIVEPREEQEIRRQIPQLTAIDGDVSHMVREQYEENPYPRWLELGAIKPASMRSILTHELPHLKDRTIDWPAAPEILIAGCGTGHEPIYTASRYQDSSVLALDLSLTSLAYADRKRRDLGVGNLELMQADIIKLGQLDRRFDLIQCSGVLHHMDDPEAGWRVLVDLLKPGGLMFVCLYSDHARQPVVAARALIAEKDYRPTLNDIRQCRYDIIGLAEDHAARVVSKWSDFFTTSACRDLIFHAQEHRFTIPRIAAALDQLGLEFLGFHGLGARVPPRYRERFPEDTAMTDLTLWDEFEKDNPDAFNSMYQFWTYKPA